MSHRITPALRAPTGMRLLAALLVGLTLGLMQPHAASADEDSGRFFAAMGRPEWSVVGSGERPLAAAFAEDGGVTKRRRGRRVASLGPAADGFDKPSLTGGGRIAWHAPSSCLAGRLASVVADVAANFGPVRVSSTCRSRRHNARAGGARRSLHLTGNAVDFRVFGNVRAVHAYLRSHGSVGGLKHYGGGLFHIDTGARRPM